ncbi:MAG: M20/M25/M40 family metallo-hydrolase [Candidatus Adiutrix sp.]|jgi:tripeptide aminopeptidase|nr:M20/M25/M40 family metallo-hydrolase [Candidatus Adiutrix sp.]
MPAAPIIEDFLDLVRLNVNSLKERAIADDLRARLTALGLDVEEDDVGGRLGGEAGNLIARLPGEAGRPVIMFSAHMDRVENHGRIRPVVDEARGIITSDGTSILAADDVTGLAAILDGLRRVRAAGRPHGEVEVVFSAAEEIGLLGARHLDFSRLKARTAYVLDCGGDLGLIVNQAPTQYSFLITVHGRSAHAGIAPETGLSAIRVAATALTRLPEGRLSPVSTSNFGVIQAGQATNIVCERCEIKGEARSTDQAELKAYLEKVKLVFEETAREFGAEAQMETSLEYLTFRVEEDHPAIDLARRAMKNLGLTARVTGTGGGMDGNHFNQHGLTAVGLAPGFSQAHTPREEQSIAQLIDCGRLVAEIIWEAAEGRSGI